ncbi:beta-lactamase [Allomuricauda ruestringensis DSM 13258]|uniref:Beta-lactamase n=1 Tax=Allomuricauda ruestringensis (strain DSM 13258 / CIP 107369 / LMG 19739 / B1) TaxID=886377 RepID=G2PPW1_ALLRU|nr:serine hydrolase domain-containing protein [Allomuricauda ruestringensis]AEM71539.1 beta-lactamase [Allomuricauda ruestringensis DSM 13258]
MSRLQHKFLIFVLVLGVSFVYGQVNRNEIPTIKGNRILQSDVDEFIRHQMDSLQVAGLSIAIVRNNTIVYEGAFGFKNLVTQDECTPNTLFEACSLSKPVFAYFVMLQVKKGLLDLDRPLYHYLPNEDLADDVRYKRITARMVLCHTSGLPNWRENTGGKLKLLFDPGSKFGYSGEAYQYLKDVLKRVLNVDEVGLDDLFQEAVVQPLELEMMRFTWQDVFASKKAYGHRDGIPTQNGPKALRKGENTFGAAYSLHTTASDYAKFLIHLMDRDKYNDEFVQQWLSLQMDMPNEEGEMHRSLIFPVKQVGETIRYYHSGNNGDFRAYCHFYRSKGYGLVMFSNSDVFFSSGCAQRIIEFLNDKWFYM